MSMLQTALEVALQVHKGQVDKAGQEYILHPIRVMLQMNTEFLKTIAVLHDVLEDSSWTENDLINAGISKEAVEQIKILTRLKHESYSTYLQRIAGSHAAMRVKLADLKDNMDLNRLDTITTKDFERNIKYQDASEYLAKQLLLYALDEITL